MSDSRSGCCTHSQISCLALRIGLLMLMCFAGCKSLKPEDPLSSHYLPGDVEPDRGIFTDFTDGLVASARASVGMGPDEGAAQQLFSEAMSVYQNAAGLEGGERRREFERAAKSFNKAAQRWPKSSVEEDAMFYRAESLFFADKYPGAEAEFGNILSQYQSSRHVDAISRRRFQIAQYWLDHHEVKSEPAIVPNFTSSDRPTFDKFGNAIKILEGIRLDDPTGELADDATMLAALSTFKKGNYYRADELLTDLRRSFPNSKHQYDAHMLGLQCKVQLYQGPSYDSGPLEDAEELVRQMRRQFPSQASKDNEFLARAFKDIRMNRAIREMHLAQYRDRRKEYRAARTLYQRVVEDYSDTSLASDAETRLAQLGGLPDLPPQRLEWLARAFPSTNQDQPLIAARPGTSR